MAVDVAPGPVPGLAAVLVGGPGRLPHYVLHWRALGGKGHISVQGFRNSCFTFLISFTLFNHPLLKPPTLKPWPLLEEERSEYRSMRESSEEGGPEDPILPLQGGGVEEGWRRGGGVEEQMGRVEWKSG